MNRDVRDTTLYKILDTIIFGEHDNPGDAFLHRLWTGFGFVGLIAFGMWANRLQGRGQLWAFPALIVIWLVGLILQVWFNASP